MLNAGGYSPTGGNTAYDALLEGGADSEGLALAMALLCQTMDLSCQVISGTLNGQSHFWNMVESSAGRQYVDLTTFATSGQSLYTDEELSALGYVWDNSTVSSN